MIRKLRSARHRLTQAIAEQRERTATGKKNAAFEAWVESLVSNSPDVLIGANFAEYGGVRQHIQSIAKYSTLNVELAPSDSLLKNVTPHEFTSTFHDRFFEFAPRNIRAIHSHVFPWFIDWCRHNQGKGAKWVHTYHLPYFPEHARGTLMEWQSRFNEALIDVARHADVRISVARWQQDYLRSVHDIDTVYIPNGVDVASTDLASASRFSNPFPGERFILYVGRNDPVKNPADYVRLAQRLPRQRFVMAGRGLSRDVMETEWSVSVPANLAVVGELAHASALDAIAASAALVVTSHREGLPTLVLEAMSLSKPTVVPDELGSVEAAGNGEFAMIYKPLDVDDLAEKVEAVISGPSVIAGARERVLGEYDWRVVARQLDAIYTDGAS